MRAVVPPGGQVVRMKRAGSLPDVAGQGIRIVQIPAPQVMPKRDEVADPDQFRKAVPGNEAIQQAVAERHDIEEPVCLLHGILRQVKSRLYSTIPRLAVSSDGSRECSGGIRLASQRRIGPAIGTPVH